MIEHSNGDVHTGGEQKRSVPVLIGLVLLFIGFLLAVKVLFPQLYQQAYVVSMVGKLGLGPVAGYLVIGFIILQIGIPRLLVVALAGLMFGFVEGMLWSMLLSVANGEIHYVVFRKIPERFAGIDAALRKHNLGKLGQSVASVTVTRFLPVPDLVLDLVLSRSVSRRLNYTVGSAIGFLLGGLPALVTGAGFAMSGTVQSTIYIVTGIGSIFLANIYINRTFKERNVGGEIIPTP